MKETPPPQSDSMDSETHARALALIADGKLAEAESILQSLADSGTTCWEVYNDLGALAASADRADDALTMLNRAVALEDAPGKARLSLATLQYLLGDYESALATLSPLLRTQPHDIEVLTLVRQCLGAAPELSSIAWARLLTDIRNPTQEINARVEQLNAFEAERLVLTKDNRRLQAQLDTALSELTQRTGRRGDPQELPWEAINTLTDREWLEALIQSVRIPSFRGFPLPLFPEASLQEGMVGSSNEGALREGVRFYSAVTEICRKHGVTMEKQTRLLDFGTGWGRYARIFMKDIHPDNIVGVDVDPGFIRICNESFPYGRFETVPAFPPTTLESSGYDLIVAYSVFSHLSESAANAWVREFARVLAPGGVMAITTQGRTFLKLCENMREKSEFEHPWHRNLARSFVDLDACEAAYDAGEFLFSATGGGDNRPAEFYGEALIPRGYVEQHWTDEFELLEYVDARAYLPQALIVMRRRG